MFVIPRFRPGTFLLAGVLVFNAGGATARAQDAKAATPPDPVLEALVAEALSRNPDLLSAEAAIAAARQRPQQASALPDPMVSLSYTNDGWAPSLGRMPMTTLALMASQNLPWPGKRRLRSDIAARDAGLAEQQLARARLTVAAEVKQAYIGLLAARELQALAREQRGLWQDIEVVVRSRYAVGQGAQQDVLRVQVEVTRVEQREIEQATEAQVRMAELSRLIAGPVEVPPEAGVRNIQRPVTGTLAESLDRARAISPELAAARLAIDRDRLSVALAEKALKPDFTVQASVMNRGGLDPVWFAGVGINVPFNRKARAAAIAEADLTVKSGERAVESLDLQLRYRTEERFNRIKAAERTITLYDQGIVLQDRMTLEAAVANYQSGTVPFASVLEAMTTLAGDRWTRATLVADHESLVANLEEMSLDAVPSSGASIGAGRAPGGRASGSGMSGGMERR
jgi:cobalt-zinc-cadmium efflux system outer membrane protein